MLGFFHHFCLSTMERDVAHLNAPTDSFKDNGSGSLDRVEVRSLLKQLNKAVGRR